MVSRRVSTNRLGPFAGSPDASVCDATAGAVVGVSVIMSVWAAPWIVAAASGSVTASARAEMVRMPWRYGRWLIQWMWGMLRVATRAARGQSRTMAAATVMWASPP